MVENPADSSYQLTDPYLLPHGAGRNTHNKIMHWLILTRFFFFFFFCARKIHTNTNTQALMPHTHFVHRKHAHTAFFFFFFATLTHFQQPQRHTGENKTWLWPSVRGGHLVFVFSHPALCSSLPPAVSLNNLAAFIMTPRDQKTLCCKCSLSSRRIKMARSVIYIYIILSHITSGCDVLYV